MKLLILLCLFGVRLSQAKYGSDENSINQENSNAKVHAMLKAAQNAKYGSSSDDSKDDDSLQAANKGNFVKYSSDSDGGSLDNDRAKLKSSSTAVDSSSDSSEDSSDDVSDISALESAKRRFARKLGADSDESLKEDDYLKTANQVMFAKYGSDSDESEDKLMGADKKKLIEYVKECLLETQTEPQTLMKKLKQGKLDRAVTSCFYKKVGIIDPANNLEGRKLTDDFINNELTKYGIEPRMVKECVVKNESLEGARKCVLKHYLRF